jgi:hypothetical protein
MELTLESRDSSLIDKLQQSLETQGLKTNVKSAQRTNQGLVETHLTIEEMT